ncbi:MAG: magnesium transporter, partial [Alloalcanivorax venustensis]
MTAEQTRHRRNLKTVNRALASGTFSEVRQVLNNLPGAEAAHLIESSPPREREILWQLLSQEQETEVLQYLGEEVRVELLRD